MDAMKLRWTALVLGVAACAEADPLVAPAPSGSNSVPAADAGGLDAAPEDDDAGPCTGTDCEYFPPACSPDALCPNGPFGSTAGDGGLDPVARINVIRGRSVGDVWAAGTSGSLAHFDGTSWKPVELGTVETLNALWLPDSGEIALAQMSRVYTRDAGGGAPQDGQWARSELPVPWDYPGEYDAKLTSAWSAPGSPWLWCTMTSSWSPYTGLWRMRRLPTNELEIQSGVGTDACIGAGCTVMKSIHGASANELWAVGDIGAAVRIHDADGDTPSVEPFNTQTRNVLNGVWVASPSDAWAVGAAGTIRHYTGDTMLWDVVSHPGTTEDLRAVWGSSSADVWAVGDGGLVLHYDGEGWTRIKVAGVGKRRPNLTAVWVPAPGHVWVGGDGVILSLGGMP